ncbi:MAG: helix-hairpin-helix domain-containing protein [bacterium]
MKMIRANLFNIFNRYEQKAVLFLIAWALIATTILIITHIQREKTLSKIEVVHSAFEIFEEETYLHNNKKVIAKSILNEMKEVDAAILQDKITSPLARNARKELYKVNINTASLGELETLPRIGSTLANRIIEYRKTHGSFKSIEDITKVKGIGTKTFEKLKGMIILKDEIENDKK